MSSGIVKGKNLAEELKPYITNNQTLNRKAMVDYIGDIN